MTERKDHPSYGMLSFSRSNIGGGVALFGSSILHSNTIRLSITKGFLERRDSNDYHYSGVRGAERYIEVEMSYSQFAETITSLNMGSGIPVTIRQIGGQRIEPCPYEDKQAQFRQEFASKAKETATSLAALAKTTQALFESKKSLTKADKEEIVGALNSAAMEIASNMPFVYELFQAQMQKTVTEAKGEIESFVQNRINSIAMTAMAEKSGQILGDMGNGPILPAPADGEGTEYPDGNEQPGISMGGQSL